MDYPSAIKEGNALCVAALEQFRKDKAIRQGIQTYYDKYFAGPAVDQQHNTNSMVNEPARVASAGHDNGNGAGEAGAGCVPCPAGPVPAPRAGHNRHGVNS